MADNRPDPATQRYRPPPSGARTGGPKVLLAAALGYPMPADEKAMWDAMSAEQREVALLRLNVLMKFSGPLKPPTVEEAAAEANLSVNRWYEMFSSWREKRSLSSIGIGAAMPRSRTVSYHNDLERLVVKVVDADPKASVRRLALALGEAYGTDTGTPAEDWPSYITLRKFVEAELRLRSQDEEPGREVMFDCCACELPHADGVFTAFLVLDRGTRIVLGAALGHAGESRAGYSLAARNAIDRMKHAPFDRLGWAATLERSELVIGLDEKAWTDHAAEMSAVGLKGQLKPVSSGRRFGSFVRPLIGYRMGRVKFVPGKTAKGEADASPTQDDVVRFGVELDAHNADLVGNQAAEGRVPPASLMTLLKRLAKR